MSGSVAVVTIAHGRHEHLARQHESLARNGLLPDHYIVVSMGDDEIVASNHGRLPSRVIHVAADPDELPLARARNVGVAEALRRGAEVLVLLDVDCLAGVDLVEGYRSCATDLRDVVWSGPVTYLPPAGPQGYDLDRLAGLDDPHPARPDPRPGQRTLDTETDLFWSLSFAMHRDAWIRAGGFCELYRGYGGEDSDFALTAIERGLRLGWTGDARAYHQHHPVSTPPVEHLQDILRNGRLFHQRWGRWPMVGWLEGFERLGLVAHSGGDWHAVVDTIGDHHDQRR